MFLVQPLAGPAQLQPGAIHQQMQGLGTSAGTGPRHVQRRGPAAQRAVVGDGEVEPEQAYNGADQALRLTQGQPEHGLERQCRQDCQGRVGRLPAPGRPGRGHPRRDRLLGEPDRQAPTLAQARVILTPVRDPEPLPGDAVATVGIGFERHRASQVRGLRLSYPGPLAPPIAGSLQQGPSKTSAASCAGMASCPRWTARGRAGWSRSRPGRRTRPDRTPPTAFREGWRRPSSAPP